MEVAQLELISRKVRREVIEFKTKSGYGHLASTLSIVDVLVSLYYNENSNFRPSSDVLCFGKAHGGPAVYPILADLGFFPKAELAKYCTPEGILRLHPDFTIPGCDFVGGSLGNAIGYIAGRALAEPERRFVVVLGDAELYEGSVWEALIFIAHHKLRNVLMIVDRNGLGTIGFTEELLALEPLQDKFVSFGIETDVVDGHDFEALNSRFNAISNKPRCVIAKTIKSKGVSFMEGIPEYHTKYPTDRETVELMLGELK
jgi:transketolase